MKDLKVQAQQYMSRRLAFLQKQPEQRMMRLGQAACQDVVVLVMLTTMMQQRRMF
jgi:hypothetical protein